MLIFNAHHDVVPFKLPKVVDGRGWLKLIDSNEPESGQDDGGTRIRFGQTCDVAGRSVLVLRLVDERRRPSRSAKSPGARA
jgi:isoamylase